MAKTLIDCLRIPFYGETFLEGSNLEKYSKSMENANDLIAQKRIDFFDYGNTYLRKYSDNELGKEDEESLDEKKDYAFEMMKNATRVSKNLSEYAKIFNEEAKEIELAYFDVVERIKDEKEKLDELKRKRDAIEEDYYSKFEKKGFFEKLQEKFYLFKKLSKEEVEKNREKLLLEKELKYSNLDFETQKSILKTEEEYALSLQNKIKELTKSIDVVMETKNNLFNLENFYKSYLESFN